MTAEHDTTGSLRHHFLVASPWLADPRFHGGVIYLCEHSEEGALGLMINQPLDIHLGEILEQLDRRGEALVLRDIPVVELVLEADARAEEAEGGEGEALVAR